MRTKYLIVAAILVIGLGVAGLRADNAPAAAKSSVTHINLHLQGAMAQDAFDELAKQGGVKFSNNNGNWDQNGLETEHDIDMTDRPFWSAVNEVCGLWGLSAQPNYMYGGGNNPNQIMLVNYGNRNGQKNKIPAFESDGFVVQAMSFSRQQSVNYAMPQQSENYCYVHLQVYVDPAMHISSLDQNPKVDQAVDDAGNSMMPDKNSPRFGNRQQRSLVYNCMVPMKYPDNIGKKIADLKCTFSIWASDAVDNITVDKPLEAAETSKDFGETKVTFRSLKKNANGTYELKIGMTEDDPAGPYGRGNAWKLLQTAQLLDSKGRTYSYAGGGSGGDMVDYTVNYQAPNNGQDGAAGEPVKWTLELPTKSHTIKLPVEFKDLPLP